jgi:hypothetical protein
MFGHDSLPTRNWQFGCRPPHEGVDYAKQQMILANNYRNKRVELELARRNDYYNILTDSSPELGAMVKKEGEFVEQLGELEVKLNNERIISRSRKGDTGTIKAMKAIRKELKELRALIKEARAAALADDEVRERLDQATEDNKNAIKKARDESNLYWGNYLAVDQAAMAFGKGTPPKFKKFTGDGRVTLQLQKGLTWEAALAGKDTRLQIRKVHDRQRGKKNGSMFAEVWLRVGSTENKQPIWCKFACIIHRQPPMGSRIKWAFLHRRIIGGREYHREGKAAQVVGKERWTLTLSLANKITGAWDPGDQADHGVVGVDIGFRMVPQGLRVAYWSGSDGRSGPLILPNEFVDDWYAAHKLHSVIDNQANEFRAELAAWLKANKEGLPEWLAEATSTIGQWKNRGRLIWLELDWRDNRFQGDEQIFERFTAWRRANMRVTQQWANKKLRLQDRRLDTYRNFAADLRREYHVIGLEKLNLTFIHQKPTVENAEQDKLSAAQRETARIAALSELKNALAAAMASVVLIDPGNTTKACHNCGSIEQWDQATEVMHTCSKCHELWDQDLNAAINLRKLAEDMPEPEPGVDAPVDPDAVAVA